ncbi:hypothetical protein [uncultured Flavobacterium sp.]|jgi:hypothetical protein|uniref:hypothetical protein n=1 Tax=uncultured Flavobacterium sp. TaxID=165435 RepID=UPI0030ED0AAC|tara:strand:+ start:816 stop:1376 length:561 start_codon:yes stop_codon:yes gene_type:complete
MQELVHTNIRPHLVSFFMKEFNGIEASYEGRKVMYVRFLPSSSIAKYLYELINYKRKRDKQDQFLLFLSLEKKKTFQYSGLLYIDQEGVKSPLLLETKKAKHFNDLLEDMFRVSFVFFINGSVRSGLEVRDAINSFIDDYELLDCGFDNETLRGLYYRQKKTKILSRFQVQSSNQVLNYASNHVTH